MRFEDQPVDVDDESTTPMIHKSLPTVFPGKNVFLESYSKSDSPEWTRVENPVINMEDEVLPEELEDGDPAGQLQNEEDLPKPGGDEFLQAPPQVGEREREPKQDQPRRHPLSQVTNAEDMASALDIRLRSLRFGQQRNGHPGAPIFISDDDEEKDFSSDVSGDGGPDAVATTNNGDENGNDSSHIEDDDEGEKPQDDTFEFLKRGTR